MRLVQDLIDYFNTIVDGKPRYEFTFEERLKFLQCGFIRGKEIKFLSNYQPTGGRIKVFCTTKMRDVKITVYKTLDETIYSAMLGYYRLIDEQIGDIDFPIVLECFLKQTRTEKPFYYIVHTEQLEVLDGLDIQVAYYLDKSGNYFTVDKTNARS